MQVTSYNGATSADPHMLRITTEAPRAPASTPARTVTGTAGPAVGSLPTGFNTLFLVDRQRLEGLYGAGGATSVLNAIAANQASFTTLGFPNAVLSVDAYAAVQTAYANWDANPGNPDLANKVVAAINAVVDAQVRSQPNGAGLKYLVIVGGDRVIPQGRLGDFTVSGERERLRGHLRPLERPLRHAARRADALRRPVRHPRARAVPQPAAARAAACRWAGSSRRRRRSSPP